MILDVKKTNLTAGRAQGLDTGVWLVLMDQRPDINDRYLGKIKTS